MKKSVIFFIIVIAFLGMIWYIYEEAKILNNQKVGLNSEYEQLLNKEISGVDLASLINRCIDRNVKNEVEKDNKGIYKSNNLNSINIEIKFIDNDNTIKFEKLYDNGINKFIELYGISKFELKKINYHQKSGIVKYLYFEEIN